MPFFADFLAGNDDSLDEEQAFAAAASTQYFNRRKLSIYGGANEIQKNIVAKTIRKRGSNRNRTRRAGGHRARLSLARQAAAECDVVAKTVGKRE